MHALLVTMDGGGNLPPALGIARALVRDGHTARFLGHETQRRAIEGAGFALEPFTRGRAYDSSAPRSTLRALRDLTAVFADRGIGQDAVAAASAQKTDVVIVDCLLWGALDTTARAGLPVVSLVHSLYGYFQANARGPVGLIGRLRGVDPVAASAAAAVTLVATRRDFEPDPDAALASGVQHLGFVWQETPVEAVSDPNRPRVLVSFSTTSFPGQAEALQTTLDALDGLPIEIVATTGPVDPAGLRVPAGAQVARRRDHGDLLPATALVIGHGGHSTTARALSHGIPLLVLPMHPLMDQPAVGRAVQRHGVGRMLRKTADATTIRRSVVELLADGPHRDAARRLGVQARSADGAVAAVDALARV